tara:strand:+ start:166 stop:561 length:396 start_codon:yes stop_codon:yes gene_type:complete
MTLNSNLKISSNRSFGLLFCVVFLIIGLWPLKSGEDFMIWPLIISTIFLVLGILNSKLLYPLNRLWFRFGLLLGSIVSPIVMGLIYFIVLAPMGIFMRLLGKDLLKTRKIKKASTYWIKPNKQNSSMKKQF